MRYTLSFDLRNTRAYRRRDPWDDVYCLVHATGGRHFEASDAGRWGRLPNTTVEFVSDAETEVQAADDFAGLVERMLGIPIGEPAVPGGVYLEALWAVRGGGGGYLSLVDPPPYATGTRDEAREELMRRLSR